MGKISISEECADKIIIDWIEKVRGKELIIFGNVFKIKDLIKEDLLNGYFRVIIDTGTPHTGELKETLYSLMLLDLIDQYDWVLYRWK